jgi:purine-binding chemotaxis protein CheW
MSALAEAAAGAAALPGDGAGGAEAAAGAAARRDRYVAIRVGDALYGLDVEEVEEVIDPRPLTRVFHAPPAMGGVASLRGEVLPVIDLGVLLGREARASEREGRIVVVRERAGERRRAGLWVDELGGLRELPESGLMALPSTVSGLVGEAAVGVIPDPPPCTVLSVGAILGAPELAGLAHATTR